MKEEQKNTVNQINNDNMERFTFNDIEYFKKNHELNREKSEFKNTAIKLIASALLSLMITYTAGCFIRYLFKDPEVQHKPPKQVSNKVKTTEIKRDADTQKSRPKVDTNRSLPKFKSSEEQRRYLEIMKEIEEKKELYSKINKQQDWYEFHRIFPHTSNINRDSKDEDVTNELGKPDQIIGMNGITSWIYRDFTIDIDERRKTVTEFHIHY